jgi:hypothetical protein
LEIMNISSRPSPSMTDSNPRPAHRHRLLHLFLLLVVIVLGLWSRSPAASELSCFIAAYAGDTLWALAIFLAIGILLPSQSTSRTALLALLLAFSIEAGELYHAHWIDAIRATRLGGLLLGYSFLWSDLVCYGCGVAIGVAGERMSELFTPRQSPTARRSPPARRR